MKPLIGCGKNGEKERLLELEEIVMQILKYRNFDIMNELNQWGVRKRIKREIPVLNRLLKTYKY